MCLAGSRPVSERVPKPSQGTRELLHQLKLVFEHQGRENSEFVVHKITTLKCLIMTIFLCGLCVFKVLDMDSLYLCSHISPKVGRRRWGRR